jgi:hypothetical protein
MKRFDIMDDDSPDGMNYTETVRPNGMYCNAHEAFARITHLESVLGRALLGELSIIDRQRELMGEAARALQITSNCAAHYFDEGELENITALVAKLEGGE